MSSILSINNLNYEVGGKKIFSNFNLDIQNGEFASIIGPNKSGKTILTKILCAIIPTDDVCILDGISLNKTNVLQYITKIGIVTNDINNPFIYNKVKDELAYPLLNLGLAEHKINKKILKFSKFFEIENLLNKKISTLTVSQKAKILIVLALIHDPKVLVLDDIFYDIEYQDQVFILNKLTKLNQEGLTIINITSKLDTIYNSSKVYILNDFKIQDEGSVLEIFEHDSYLNKLGLSVPFIIDLSLKLKFYNLIDKIYFDLDKLEDDLWK